MCACIRNRTGTCPHTCVLPTMIAPAARSFAMTGASAAAGGADARAFDPASVVWPEMSNKSLTEMGRPSTGDRITPIALSLSDASASARADSSNTARMGYMMMRYRMKYRMGSRMGYRMGRGTPAMYDLLGDSLMVAIAWSTSARAVVRPAISSPRRNETVAPTREGVPAMEGLAMLNCLRQR